MRIPFLCAPYFAVFYGYVFMRSQSLGYFKIWQKYVFFLGFQIIFEKNTKIFIFIRYRHQKFEMANKLVGSDV
jgi:hypothetical protein